MDHKNLQQSTLTEIVERMKARHPDRLLIFDMGDFYSSFGDDAKTLNEVCGVTLTRTSAKDITAQQATFPGYELCEQLDKLVRAGIYVALC